MQRPRSQPALSTGCAHISSADCVVSNSERVAQGFRFQSSSPVDRLNEAASLTSCPEAAFDVAYHRRLVAHYRHDADGNKSGKSKGTCTGLGQINAAAFNIRSSVRDRDRDGITTLLVGDLDLGTKGQRFVRRRHGVVVVKDPAGSFGPRLRRVSHGVHRCDAVFGMNWNAEQTKYERGDQPSHA